MLENISSLSDKRVQVLFILTVGIHTDELKNAPVKGASQPTSSI